MTKDYLFYLFIVLKLIFPLSASTEMLAISSLITSKIQIGENLAE